MFRSKNKRSRSSPTDSGTGLFSWMGNIAVFYVILLALISIPFLVLAVILFIRTVIDYHVWILFGMVTLITVGLFLLIRHRKKIGKQFEEEKKDVKEIIHAAAREGHNVNISFMHGLIRLDYQGSTNHSSLLGGSKLGQLKALPMNTSSDEPAEIITVGSENLSEFLTLSIASELERLSSLLDQGLLTEGEFQELKGRLLKAKEV